MILWKDVRTSRDPGGFHSYFKKHPKGTFTLLANEKIESLKKLADAKPASNVTATAAGVFFSDDFDGDELGKDWGVMNPNPDAYTVEDGKLTVLLSYTQKPALDNIPNVYRLLELIPKGDWTMTVRIEFSPQMMSEWMRVSVPNRD